MNNKILIIEDEVELCFLLQQFLTKKHYNVECRTTLREGLEKLQVEAYDYLILDNNLPDGKGMDILYKICPVKNDMRIIMMSAISQKDTALTAGVDFFMEKPVSLKRMYETLHEQ